MNNEKSSRMTAIKTEERITSLTTQADFFSVFDEDIQSMEKYLVEMLCCHWEALKRELEVLVCVVIL